MDRVECIKKHESYIARYINAIWMFEEAQAAMDNATNKLVETPFDTPLEYKIEDIKLRISECIDEVAKKIGKDVIAIKHAERDDHYEQ